MAAQARLSCPVRCAAISQGPTQPKPPQARQPAERRPRTYFQSCATFHPITFTDPLTLTSVESFSIRSWCGARGVILQNKPNFSKTKTSLITYLIMSYEKNILPANPKNKPNSNPVEPSFRAWPPAKRRPRVTTHEYRATSHETRATILQNKPNLQKCETNRNLCLKRTYETATARNSRKNKANLQKCENEPKPLFRNDLRRKMPPPTTRKANPISKIADPAPALVAFTANSHPSIPASPLPQKRLFCIAVNRNSNSKPAGLWPN